jgi:hypothetical protein
MVIKMQEQMKEGLLNIKPKRETLSKITKNEAKTGLRPLGTTNTKLTKNIKSSEVNNSKKKNFQIFDDSKEEKKTGRIGIFEDKKTETWKKLPTEKEIKKENENKTEKWNETSTIDMEKSICKKKIDFKIFNDNVNQNFSNKNDNLSKKNCLKEIKIEDSDINLNPLRNLN